MTQGLSVLTGCTAGATEAVVVVPFECAVNTLIGLTTQARQDPIARSREHVHRAHRRHPQDGRE